MSSRRESQEWLLAIQTPRKPSGNDPNAVRLDEFIAGVFASMRRMGDDGEERNAVDVVRTRGKLMPAAANGFTRQTPPS
jgi:hypothetical protein